jgi:hypothetical protein
MTVDQHAQQHRQALTPDADQPLLRPTPPPPRLAGGGRPARGLAPPRPRRAAPALHRGARGGRGRRAQRRSAQMTPRTASDRAAPAANSPNSSGVGMYMIRAPDGNGGINIYRACLGT